jgi:2-iminobutanoate/2-iminopropanoate deaminase
MKKIINCDLAPAPVGPYSQAILVNGTLYCSGQIALDRLTGKLNDADIKTETKQVMENLSLILKEAGMSFSNVVKCSIFLKDMADFGDVNTVYGNYFTAAPPARETVQVAGLPLNVNVEISLVACID